MGLAQAQCKPARLFTHRHSRAEPHAMTNPQPGTRSSPCVRSYREHMTRSVGAKVLCRAAINLRTLILHLVPITACPNPWQGEPGLFRINPNRGESSRMSLIIQAVC